MLRTGVADRHELEAQLISTTTQRLADQALAAGQSAAGAASGSASRRVGRAT